MKKIKMIKTTDKNGRIYATTIDLHKISGIVLKKSKIAKILGFEVEYDKATNTWVRVAPAMLYYDVVKKECIKAELYFPNVQMPLSEIAEKSPYVKDIIYRKDQSFDIVLEEKFVDEIGAPFSIENDTMVHLCKDGFMFFYVKINGQIVCRPFSSLGDIGVNRAKCGLRYVLLALKGKSYYYLVDWKYDTSHRLFSETIEKVPLNSCDFEEQFLQSSSDYGIAKIYYEKLYDAIKHSIIPFEEIKFVNISHEEIAALKK